LAIDKVRYAGEPVAAVVAVDERTAFEALEFIEVKYEELKGVFTPEQAMAKDAPLLHERKFEAGALRGFEGEVTAGKPIRFSGAMLIRHSKRPLRWSRATIIFP
jgi:CO/xanthine dehydrogenase Mo-binding subunit